jgi:general secretion pathway protein D
VLLGFLVACGQAPVKPSPSHIQTEEARPAGTIPPPVQITPILPKPKAVARPETYSVVVSNVRVQELLFALARDARLQIDIDPTLTGIVTLNAVDQTLQQLLTRIGRQVDLRYELDGDTLVVMRDAPFLRAYRIDYLSAARSVKMQSSASTQFGSGGAGAAAAASTTGATATVDVTSENKLWESIVQNVKEILRETDKILPAGAVPPSAPSTPPPATPGTAPAAPVLPSAGPTFQEAASVIANRESGVLYVRATAKQQERIQEFLDQVMAGARRQVLVEATVAEVQLSNEYQRGIDWQRLRTGAGGVGAGFFGTGNSGLEIRQLSTGTPATIDTNAFVIGGASNSLNFNFAIRLLESFGDVKVLSSPKLSVLNNQTALLRVTRDIVYFTITPSTTPVTVAGGAAVVEASFTTTPNIAAEGFMMAILPHINESDMVVLSVRPTIRRRVADATDPNPALTTPNLIPVFETREFDSVLRLQSGEIAVLGGLMQDSRETIEDTVPGIRSIPGLGWLFEQRRDTNRKTELVIFLRATVVRDASIDGDFKHLRALLPGEDFMSKPNPGRTAPPIGPSGQPMR